MTKLKSDTRLNSRQLYKLKPAKYLHSNKRCYSGVSQKVNELTCAIAAYKAILH